MAIHLIENATPVSLEYPFVLQQLAASACMDISAIQQIVPLELAETSLNHHTEYNLLKRHPQIAEQGLSALLNVYTGGSGLLLLAQVSPFNFWHFLPRSGILDPKNDLKLPEIFHVPFGINLPPVFDLIIGDIAEFFHEPREGEPMSGIVQWLGQVRYLPATSEGDEMQQLALF